MRLIDADALIKNLDAGHLLLGHSYIPMEVVQKIESAPTVDAVPVVRCKECKYKPFALSDDPHDLEFPECDKGYSPCPCKNEDDSWYSYIPNDDFFCSEGERRTK